MDIFAMLPFSGGKVTEVKLKNTLLQTNEKSAQYALRLSEEEAAAVVQSEQDSLKVHDRIRFGKSAAEQIIDTFMKSAYISQSDYAQTVEALVGIFYDVKEDCDDRISDVELIRLMFDFFENKCGGDLDFLQSRYMETLSRTARYRSVGLEYDEDMDDGADESEGEDYDA